MGPLGEYLRALSLDETICPQDAAKRRSSTKLSWSVFVIVRLIDFADRGMVIGHKAARCGCRIFIGFDFESLLTISTGLELERFQEFNSGVEKGPIWQSRLLLLTAMLTD